MNKKIKLGEEGLGKMLQDRIKGKTLIIGVGNTLRGDDGLGPLLIQQLDGKVEADLLDAGEVPESYLGRIIDSCPDTVVVVDVVKMQAPFGSVAVIEIDDLAHLSCSTHKFSLALFMRYIQQLTGADVFLVGVQSNTLTFGHEMTPQVQASLKVLEQYFTAVLGNTENAVNGCV